MTDFRKRLYELMEVVIEGRVAARLAEEVVDRADKALSNAIQRRTEIREWLQDSQADLQEFIDSVDLPGDQQTRAKEDS